MGDIQPAKMHIVRFVGHQCSSKIKPVSRDIPPTFCAFSPQTFPPTPQPRAVEDINLDEFPQMSLVTSGQWPKGKPGKNPKYLEKRYYPPDQLLHECNCVFAGSVGGGCGGVLFRGGAPLLQPVLKHASSSSSSFN